MTAIAGDWISFMVNNRICIAEVRYMHTRVGGYVAYITSAGEVRDESVLEVRRPKKEEA
jgi:hypothetical protein